jgi:exosome complex RNA-binding protein Csl4
MVAAITADLRSLVSDAEVRVLITVSQNEGSPSIDYAAGTVTGGVRTTTLEALRCEVNLREVEASQGGLMLGDVRFHVMQADAPYQASVGDTFSEGGSVRWRVLQVSHDPLSLLTTYTARRAA